MASQFGLFALLLIVHIVSPSKCDDFQNTNLSSDALLNIPARLVALEQTVAIIVGELQEDRSNSKKKLILEEDIVTHMNQGSFAIVEEKMLELHDPAIVAGIVRDLSANSDHDFGVLVNLTKSLNNTSLKSRILLSLYRQAIWSDHINTVNLIALAKCLSGKGSGYQHGRVVGITSFKKLLEKITKSTVTTFVDALKWQEDYQTNPEVSDLAVGIAEWRDVSENVMIGLVSGVIGSVDSKKILEAVSNHTDTWQALVGVNTLIERLKDTDSLKGSIAWDMVSRINEFMTRVDLHSSVQDFARRVNDKIPEYIRSLTTLTSFCIWNKHEDSFLAPANFYYNNDNILTVALMDKRCENGSAPNRAEWQHERNEDMLVFKNSYYKNEFLHASDISVDLFHRVFTTEQTGDLDDKYSWILEPVGDSCFMKNYWNNEYLFASKVKFSQDERKIAGTKAKRSASANDNPEFVWQIVSC